MIVGLNKILLNIIHLLLSVPVALMWRYMVAKLRGQVLAEPAVSPVKGSAGGTSALFRKERPCSNIFRCAIAVRLSVGYENHSSADIYRTCVETSEYTCV